MAPHYNDRVVTIAGKARSMAAQDIFNKLENNKQTRILDTAIDEFADHGFQEASVNRIVQRLGIAKGSIFQYFGNKQGLFQYVFDHAVHLVRHSLRKVKRETQDVNFFERIRQSILAGLEFIGEHPRIYRIYLKMIFQEGFPLREQFLRQVHLFSGEYLKPLVETGISRGELRSDLDVGMTVFMLDALMDRFLQAHCVSFLDAGAGIYQAPREELKKKADAFITLLRHGMGSSTASGESSLKQ